MTVLWNLSCDFKPYKSTSILLEWRVQGIDDTVNLVNMYAPYKDRKPFWETVESSGVLRLKILIVGGDMNFTLFSNEVWGALAPLDPLASFL